jgi:hypothetical protein
MSYSQSKQDLWVLSNIAKGTYLEIGASHPININNTYLLEQNGWTGISIDIDNQCEELWNQTRQNQLIIADALKLIYNKKLYDYIQIDIDPPIQSLKVLKIIIAQGLSFKLMTFEHDAYYAGNEVRDVARSILTNEGYYLEVPDVVCETGKPYEDWWINKKYIL